MTAILARTRLSLATALSWAGVVDDHNPLHLDRDFAAATTFGRPIAHGSLLFALAADAAQATAHRTAHRTAHPTGTLTVRFRAPVPLDSTVTVERDGTRIRLRCGTVEPVEVTRSNADDPQEDPLP